MEFTSGHYFSLDAKGRLSLPARLRKSMDEAEEQWFVFARGYDHAIDLYTYNEWKKYVDTEVSKLDRHNREHRDILRKIMEHTYEEKMDKQYRLLVPKPLLEFAGIVKDVFVLGQLGRIELWNPERYRNQYVWMDDEMVDRQGEKVFKDIKK